MMSLLLCYGQIPPYFCISSIFSPTLIHHHAPHQHDQHDPSCNMHEPL